MKNAGNSIRVKQIQRKRRSKVGQNRDRGRGRDKGKNIKIGNIEISHPNGTKAREKRSKSKPATNIKGMVHTLIHKTIQSVFFIHIT